MPRAQRQVFPASRGSFADEKKRPLPWVKNGDIEHAPRLATAPLRDVRSGWRKYNLSLEQETSTNRDYACQLTTQCDSSTTIPINRSSMLKRKCLDRISSNAFGRTQAGQIWARLAVKQPQQVASMAEFSFFAFVQQAQQSGRWEFSHSRSAITQTCLAHLKVETRP